MVKEFKVGRFYRYAGDSFVGMRPFDGQTRRCVEVTPAGHVRFEGSDGKWLMRDTFKDWREILVLDKDPTSNEKEQPKFKRGDKVLVRDGKSDVARPGIFLAHIPGAIYGYLTVDKNDEDAFLEDRPFRWREWRYCSSNDEVLEELEANLIAAQEAALKAAEAYDEYKAKL